MRRLSSEDRKRLSNERHSPGQTADHEEDRIAVAAYIAAITRDLARLARHRKLGLLAYLLEMAQTEAQDIRNANGRDGARRGPLE